MKITYKQDTIEVKEKIKIEDLLNEEIKNNKYEVLGALFNNKYQRLDYEIEEDGNIELLDMSDKVGMKIYRNTLLYIMGKAFFELYPDAYITVQYHLNNSMYCDIENIELTEQVIENVKQRMKKIIERKLDINKAKIPRDKAEKFYKMTHTPKGRLQINLEENEDIEMYYSETYYNYFYEILATNTGKINLFDLKKYNKGILLIYPYTKNPDVLPEYKETKKLLWAMQEYEKIRKILDVSKVFRLNQKVKDNKIKDIILLSEALHEKKISDIADEITKKKNIKMVLIAGPSSSGKTTFAERLGIQLRLNGIKPVTISVDNYFVERQDNPLDENGNYDFECLEAIDLELFNDHLVKLLNGEEIEMPEFDFYKGTKRFNGKMLKLKDDEILVIEGIHCLNDELTSKIAKDQKYKIYISDLTVLNMDEFNRISTRDTRLIRRIVRDNRTRGYSAIETIQRWDNVAKGEVKNIFPFQENADSIFNTSLVYELGVLKDKVIPLLEEIDDSHPEHAEAQRMINMLKYFESISENLVPDNSLLKEFIGGSAFE